MLNKICRRCNEEKSLLDFNKHKKMPDGHLNICKLCVKQYKHEYYKNNKNGVVEERRLAYREKHKLLKRTKRYKNVRNISRRKRYIEDINYKLSCILRSRLKIALKGKYKGLKSLNTIGCSIEELKKYLESKFQSGMSWDNHGDWHIDHIKPISMFDLTNDKQLRKANHYTNLQPLWAIDNLRKGAKCGTI